jgi:hypothetical protein
MSMTRLKKRSEIFSADNWFFILLRISAIRNEINSELSLRAIQRLKNGESNETSNNLRA